MFLLFVCVFFFFQAEDGIRDDLVTGVQTCALPIWLHDLSRRVQHYGWKYNYKERSVQPRDYLGPLPAWLRTLADRLVERKIAASDFDQVIVNEYLPGQGIGAHVDQPAMFAEEIVTVSLASATTMRFTPARHAASGEKKVQQIRLRPRSALLLKKEARYDWKHEIPRQKSDVVTSAEPGGTPCQGGLKFRVPRSRRVSVTFRCVKKPE